MKDLQSKLDAASAECLAEKEKVITLLERDFRIHIPLIMIRKMGCLELSWSSHLHGNPT
jgi:hypothetical protein